MHLKIQQLHNSTQSKNWRTNMTDLISMEAKAIEQNKRVHSFAWALIMETAASFEVASYSISDADAKKSAEGAIKYARDTANKYYTTPQQPQSVADALEELERALCLIGVVGNVDGHDVIRRDSVINVARQRIKRNANEVSDMDIEKLAYDHGANIYENGEVRFYTLNAFNKFAEAYHQAKCNEEIQTLRAKVDVLVEALSTIRHDAYMDSSYNKTVIEIYEVADKAIMAYDKLSEVNHDTK